MTGVRSKKAEMSSSREKLAGDFLERRRSEISFGIWANAHPGKLLKFDVP